MGSGQKTSIVALANMCINVSGYNLEVIHEDTSEGEFSKLIEGKKRNTSELDMMSLDISKAKKILDWEPKIGLFEGLKKEFDWAKINIKRSKY